MTLSVNSATGALAALQALSLQTSGSAASPEPAASAPSSGAASRDVVGVSAQAAGSLADGIGHAVTAADAADAAGQTVIGLLHQMRTAADVAADPSTSDTHRADLDGQYQASAGAIGDAVGGATVGGVNLVDGSRQAGLKVALGDGVSASLTPVDLTLGGSTLGLAANASLATATAAASAFVSLGGAIGSAGAALGALQGQADQISAHSTAVQALSQASPASAEGDGMRLLALQLGQQLSTQTSAIANQSPQAILSLFRS